jgi:hypothetical protein
MAIITLNNNSLSSVTALPTGVGGKVLQVVSTTKTDTFSYTVTAPTFVDVTGLSVSITPSSASNKVLVIATYSLGSSNANFQYGKLVRDSTPIAVGDASTNRVICSNMTFEGDSNTGALGSLSVSYLDSPSTASSITYKIQVSQPGGSTGYVNRSGRDNASIVSDVRLAATITAYEIAG